MKPIEFKGQNMVFAKDQPEYLPLPALRLDDKMGQVISCQHLTFSERIRVLFTGKIWVSLCMFGEPLTPSKLTTKRKDFFMLRTDKVRLKFTKKNGEFQSGIYCLSEDGGLSLIIGRAGDFWHCLKLFSFKNLIQLK